jgi:hypothetical protein
VVTVRTPEQVEADGALTEAVERCLRAYQEDGTAWALSEYVVISSQHRWDDDGDGITAVATLYRDSDVPVHRALGLVQYAATRMRALIAED